MFGEGRSRGGGVDFDLGVGASMVAGASKSSSQLIATIHEGEDTVPMFSCAWVGERLSCKTGKGLAIPMHVSYVRE